MLRDMTRGELEQYYGAPIKDILPLNYSEMSQPMRRVIRQCYIEIQNGLCHYCRQPILEEPSQEVQRKSVNVGQFPEGFFKNPVHLHHNHQTGMTIGAVHAKCNAVLWIYHRE